MTKSTAATGVFQQIVQNVTPAASLLCLCVSSARIWGLTELQGKQRRGVGLGHELHQATENTALVWRLCFSISKTLHKLITFCWVFQACSDSYLTLSWYLCVTLPCPFPAAFWRHHPKCLMEKSHLWLWVPGSLQHSVMEALHSAGHENLALTLLVAVLQPPACHKAWDNSRKGVLLAQDLFRANIIIFQCWGSLRL